AALGKKRLCSRRQKTLVEIIPHLCLLQVRVHSGKRRRHSCSPDYARPSRGKTLSNHPTKNSEPEETQSFRASRGSHKQFILPRPVTGERGGRESYTSSRTGSRSSRTYMGRPLPFWNVWPGLMPM